MITFYPRPISKWEHVFDFHPPITLTPKEKTDHKVFKDRQEFMGFLKEHGVPLNDPEFPLRIEADSSFKRGHGDKFIVIQWTGIGWITDDYK